MKLLDDYFELKEKVHAYFGYLEDWVAIPLDDGTRYFWWCDGETVGFANSEAELRSEDGMYYENEVYTQRHLPKYVYVGQEYTMICVDTNTDGNKFLQVFSNDKKRERTA